MTSKWIEDIRKSVDNDNLFELYIEDHLERIDKLLRRAAASTDSETLLDSIQHELEDWSINGTD